MLSLKRSGPSNKTVSETQSLLNVLGGGSKEAKSILKDLQEATTNNERVLSEATDLKKKAEDAETSAKNALNESTRAMEVLLADRKKFGDYSNSVSAELSEKGKVLDLRDSALTAQKNDLEIDKKKELAVINKRIADLDIRESNIKRREINCSEEQKATQNVIEELRQLGALFSKAINKF